MNIIILAAGSGQRFKDAGYTKPKPLIRVFGKEMILWLLESLNIGGADNLYIVHGGDLDRHNFQDVLRTKYQKHPIKFIELPYLTDGPADTLAMAVIFLHDPSLPMLSLDCDTFYSDDVVGMYRAGDCGNRIFYFEDRYQKPLYSYVKIEGGVVKDIAEKRKISDHANCGAYGFKSGHSYLTFFQAAEDNYLSSVYKAMLAAERRDIRGIRMEGFHCLGTPKQVMMFSTFEAKMRNGGQVRVCWDLDNTLVTYPQVAGDYSTTKPIPRNVNLLRFLKERGCYTIIHTARVL